MAKRPRQIELRFPTAGLVRRFGYQQQAPYTTPECLNVRPYDTLEGRERGGSRPGIVRVFGGENLLKYSAEFNNAVWDKNSAAVEVLADDAVAPDGTPTADLARDNPANPNTVWMLQAVTNTTVAGGEYTFSVWMKSKSGANTSVRLAFHDNVGGWKHSGRTVTGEWARYSFTHRYAAGSTVRNVGFGAVLAFDETGAYLWGAQLERGPVASVYIPTTATPFAPLTGVAPIQCLSSVTVQGSDGVNKDVVVAITGGIVHHSSAGAALGNISGQLNASARQLHASPHHQKLYIADHRPVKVSGTDGTIASGNQLSAPSVADWTKLGIDKDLDVVLLTNTKGGIAQDDVYSITNVAAGYITIDTTLTNGACHWELARKIKVFDPVAKTLSPITVTYGIAPLNCPLACTYRDRLVFAGGNTWYMSRQGDATDWDYAYDPADPGRPVAGTNSDAGFVGEPITALIPHSDDFLIFGCENSIWMLRGDPAWGGQIDALSREVGILGASAWCKLPDGGVVFLGRDGLYGISPGGESYPQSISREVLPQELIDVDVVNNVVSMQYDIRDRGIHLFITPVDGSAGTHWWLDWQSKGLFPVSLPAGQHPYSLCSYAASLGDQKHVLLGGADGHVRRFSREATDDDGTAISSYVKFGPIRMGDLGRDGILTALEASLDEESGAVSWEVLAGDTAEAAVSASAKASGTWAAGRNRPRAPRVRDVAMVLKLSAVSRWAMESAAATLAPAGRTL